MVIAQCNHYKIIIPYAFKLVLYKDLFFLIVFIRNFVYHLEHLVTLLIQCGCASLCIC